MANEEKIYLVITLIHNTKGAQSFYQGEHKKSECTTKVSGHTSKSELIIPLWFPTEDAAQAYVEKANAEGTEREFYLIQEFRYESGMRQDEAKSVFPKPIKSDTWPMLDEGKTERSDGVWANVRSIFICDKEAAEDYIARFNEDARLAHEYSQANHGGE